jgi:hypothetical protein
MERIGVHKRWHAKFLLKQIACRRPESSNLSPAKFEDSIKFHRKLNSEITLYADGAGDDDELGGALHAAGRFGLQSVRDAEYAIYAHGESSREPLALGVLYRLIDSLIRLARNKALGAAAPHPWRTTRQTVAEVITCAYALGWNAQADKLGELILLNFPTGALWGSDDFVPHYEKTREPFVRFALALYADFAGTQLPELPAHPYDSPAYDLMLSCWRDPDPARLIEPLLHVCDWHTHECMYSASMRPSKNVDFIDDTLMGWPVEVHMLFRLRERLGLALPLAPDHPLMQVPLGPYLPPQPVPHDARIERIVERACSEVPGLREVLAGVLDASQAAGRL